MAAAQPTPSAVELYLQERWTAVSAIESDTEKCRKQIMAEYLAMGAKGRWKYHEAVRERQEQSRRLPDSPQPPPAPLLQGDLSVADIRSEVERRCAHLLTKRNLLAWVQTSYSENNFRRACDDEYIGMATNTLDFEQPDTIPLVADKAHYDGLSLDQIVNRLPELAENFSLKRNPERLESGIQEELVKVVEDLDDLNKRAETEEISDLEDQQDEIMMTAHDKYVTGCFWVQDAHADEKNEMLLVWVDQYGRAIRTNRESHPNYVSGRLQFYLFTDSPLWQYAEQSDLYNPLPDEEIDRLNAI